MKHSHIRLSYAFFIDKSQKHAKKDKEKKKL